MPETDPFGIVYFKDGIKPESLGSDNEKEFNYRIKKVEFNKVN